MPILDTFLVADPRHPNRCVNVYARISSFGEEPHGHGEHFDPGCGPEFEIRAIANESGSQARLFDVHLIRVEASVGEAIVEKYADRRRVRYL